MTFNEYADYVTIGMNTKQHREPGEKASLVRNCLQGLETVWNELNSPNMDEKFLSGVLTIMCFRTARPIFFSFTATRNAIVFQEVDTENEADMITEQLGLLFGENMIQQISRNIIERN